MTRCLKITGKISVKIASGASFCILSGQKCIENAKNSKFWLDFENLKLAVKQCYQTGHFKKMPKIKHMDVTFFNFGIFH